MGIKVETPLKAGSSTSTTYERTGASIGLENVSFASYRPIINADGAVAARFKILRSEAKNYRMLLKMSTHIVDRDGYLYAMSCAIDGCGANAPSEGSQPTFFGGISGLNAH